MKNKIFVFSTILILLVAIFHQQLSTHLKILLFITEEFPQITVKPLGLITLKPDHQKVALESSNGEIVADMFIPQRGGSHSAVIVAMGVKTQEKDKPLILSFAQTMARLGYVTLWPRLEVLDKGQSLPEEPETFIEAFKYLETLPQVDPKRISYVGFSVGSSIAFVASAEPKIRDKVYGLVFFGGYFDIFEYLLALYNKTSWQPHQDAINHAMTLLSAKGIATQSAELAQTEGQDRLKEYSPKEFISDFKAKIFILHDKSDTFVPYVESVKLNQALKDKKIFLLINLFEHVQPNKPFTLKNIGELFKLYGFLYQVFNFL